MTLLRLAPILFILIFSEQAFAELIEKQEINGIWQTLGYGYLFEIQAPEVSIYEVTNTSCLISGLSAGKLVHDTRTGFSVTIPGFIDAFMEVRVDVENTKLHFLRNDTNTVMTAKRVSQLPARCAEKNKVRMTDITNVFLANYKEHYPFFAMKETSFAEFSGFIRSSEATNEKELFSVFVNALKELYDSHVIISAPSIDGFFWGSGKENKGSVNSELREELYTVSVEHYADFPPKEFGNNQMVFTILQSSIAYLKIKSFNNFSVSGKFKDEARIFEQALDAVLAKLDKVEGLIIDIRGNSGGSDKLALALAERLTSEKYIAYYKQAFVYSVTKTEWTDKKASWVNPTGRSSYLGNIALITDYDTVSAAETFAMAVMDRGHPTIRIGQNTRGAFSDILPRTLPNRWLLGLPNERYIDRFGVSYDETGIPPEIVVSYKENSEDTPLKSDYAIDKAIDYLKSFDK